MLHRGVSPEQERLNQYVAPPTPAHGTATTARMIDQWQQSSSYFTARTPVDFEFSDGSTSQGMRPVQQHVPLVVSKERLVWPPAFPPHLQFNNNAGIKNGSTFGQPPAGLTTAISLRPQRVAAGLGGVDRRPLDLPQDRSPNQYHQKGGFFY